MQIHLQLISHTGKINKNNQVIYHTLSYNTDIPLEVPFQIALEIINEFVVQIAGKKPISEITCLDGTGVYSFTIDRLQIAENEIEEWKNIDFDYNL